MSPNNLYIVVIAVFIVVIGYDIYNWLKGRTITAPEIRLARFKSKINRTVFILGVTLVTVSILFHVNILRYRPPIEYTKINSITLKDFIGYRLPNQTLDGMKKFAFITTTIDWKKYGNEIEVKSLFHPARSYVYNENIVSKFLLQHELYHFHIVEVFARKCREELSEFKETPTDADIQNIISTHKTLEIEMQRDYDDKTYHGYILKEQKQWQLKVDTLLSLLDKFRNSKIRY